MDVKKTGTHTVLVLDGDLTSDDMILAFKAKMQELIDGDHIHIVLDFVNVHILNSSGIGKVLLFYKKLKEKNGSMSFVHLSPSIEDLFDKLMFLNLFKIYRSYDEIK
ncbi:MAG: STAS domain-containing protein [Spirochaetes bacterium]|nr:STAS domain-containing protein [Spirochaetota bacterium]